MPYPPLCQAPPFRAVLDRFRREELLRRGAEHVVHNIGVFDTLHSSEDSSAELEISNPGGVVTLDRPEESIEEEAQAEVPTRR